jgi:hypothetical protein
MSLTSKSGSGPSAWSSYSNDGGVTSEESGILSDVLNRFSIGWERLDSRPLSLF